MPIRPLPTDPSLENLKKQAKHFWDFLAGLQERRRGAREEAGHDR